MLDAAALQKKRQRLPISIGAVFFSILAGFVFALCALLLAQKFLLFAPTYSDFVVGAITWDAATKFQDIASYPTFLLAYLCGGWLTYSLFHRVLSMGSYEHEQSLITTLTWWLVPVAIGMGGFLSIYPSASSFSIVVGIFGAAITALAVRLHLSLSDMLPQQIGVGVLAVLLIGLLPFGVATIQDRLPIFGEEFRFGSAPKVGVILVIASTLNLFFLSRRSSSALVRFIPKLLLVAQLGLAPLYLLILPDLYVTGTGEPAIHTTAWLSVLGLGLLLSSVADVVKRYRNFVLTHATDLNQLLSPVAFFATIILLRYGATSVPNVPSDDYHFGESLLGWWSLWEFGKIPYVDYFQPHGIFGDDISGYISLIFYDGTAATLAEADRLAGTLTMFVAFIALRIYTGSLGLAYVSILLFGTVARKLFYLMLVPFFCLWLRVSKSKPQSWLWMWLISATFLVLLIPPQGLLAVMASTPLVGLYLYRARHINWKRVALMLAMIVALLVLFTPIPAMLSGAIHYVLENGSVNQIAYGVPWSWSWSGATQDKSKTILVTVLEVLRMSWVWIPLVAVALNVILFRQREYRPYLIGVALPVLLFATLMTPYAMGRIDPASMSRPGILANFAWAILLPILLTPLLESRGRAVLAVGVGFICSAIGLANVNNDGLYSVLEKNKIDNLWSGTEHGLKNMGSGLVEPLHIDRLVRINSFLSSHLAYREAYLDLTGRNAQYMYFDRPPAMSTTAPYNLAPVKQQQRAVERLKKALPRIALIEADNINHDGGGMALRTHLLYRFVLKNYDAELHDGYVYGVAKSNDIHRVGISFTVRQITDANWMNGVHRSDNAIVIRDSLSVRYLQVGDLIVLPDNKSRKITRVWPEGHAIWFDGARYVPNVSDNHPKIQLMLDEGRRQQLSTQLMDRIFAVADLRKVPVAWGKSASSLNGVMKHIADLDFAHAGLHDLVAEGDTYRVIGSDPYFWLDLTQQNLAGQSAGLLRFDFNCEGGNNPQFRIFWWGDDMSGAAQTQSLIFTAANGSMIVPLDAYPGWLGMKKVQGLRIDLETAGACQKYSVKKASLNQRTNISE